MLSRKNLERYAEVLIWGLRTARTGKFKRGDAVQVLYDAPAVHLAEVVQEKLLTAGLNPVMRCGMTPAMERNFYSVSDRRRLTFIPPGEQEFYENLNGRIHLFAPATLAHLRDIDPKRIALATVARKELRDIMDRRENQGLFAWSLCTVPTEALASQARMTLRRYERQVIRACYLDAADPVTQWRTLHKAAMGIKRWLNGMKVRHYHVESRNIDLIITPGECRLWCGITGHNIPSFEIYLSPDWRGTEGRYFADLPTFRDGKCVVDARFEFAKGVGRLIGARTGEAFTRSQLSMDKGACRVGEFSLTDRRFSRIDRFMADTLYDENFGGKHGNCHLALGFSYADTYRGDPSRLDRRRKKALGFNDSALHWDFVNTEPKTVTAHLSQGKKVVIYEKGEFCY
ncbi:MAG TPA: aminopeptidase [Syntrophales bacterium]|nr:aminopeptidase [Syntrophales bacterium]HOX93563.1 aminopeptidase [Syntrophales bacterium]HPI56764.1 aminopeptidase [Syntrophales bacterium]HPN25925.1 aminopeptidase [Syntrophales bacterium]HQM28763.1 aminopeptidase [Syntrophales bacterium]